MTGNRGPEKFKPSQEDYGDTGHSINNVGGSINKNYSTTIKEQQAKLSIKRLGVLLEHISPKRKIFERDNPTIPSTHKENITDPMQSSRTLGLLPCVITLQGRNMKFSQSSNKDQIMKETPFNSCKMEGIELGDMYHL